MASKIGSSSVSQVSIPLQPEGNKKIECAIVAINLTPFPFLDNVPPQFIPIPRMTVQACPTECDLLKDEECSHCDDLGSESTSASSSAAPSPFESRTTSPMVGSLPQVSQVEINHPQPMRPRSYSDSDLAPLACSVDCETILANFICLAKAAQSKNRLKPSKKQEAKKEPRSYESLYVIQVPKNEKKRELNIPETIPE